MSRRKPTPETPFDKYPSGVLALVRTGRAGRTSVAWSAPFETGLYLQHDAYGHACCLALQAVNDWAEYDPRRGLEADFTLLTEDYYLQILEIRPSGQPPVRLATALQPESDQDMSAPAAPLVQATVQVPLSAIEQFGSAQAYLEHLQAQVSRG